MSAREALGDDWHRCFIALVPDAATRDALAALPVGAAARRVAVDQLHMTLAFLGNVAPDNGEALAVRLLSVVQSLPLLRAERSEYWPSAAHPRLVVVPFAAEPGLAALETQVRDLVAGLGLPVDDHRPFRPHVTLARFARTARPPCEVNASQVTRRAPSPLESAPLCVEARFDTLTLYSSTLARHGARYRALASVPLPSA